MEKDFLKLPFSIQIALLSFLIGTLLFACYFIFPKWDNIIFVGILYVIATIIFNLIVLINLLINFFTAPFQRKNCAIEIVIVLANIPIAFIYFSIIIYSISSKSLF